MPHAAPASGSPRRARRAVVVWAVLTASLAVGVAPAFADLSVEVRTATAPVPNMAASQTGVSVACPAGSALAGGGIRAYYAGVINPADPYHPINGLVVRGLMTSDAAGNVSASGVTTPTTITAYSGFAGQSEAGDEFTGFAMCVSGGFQQTVIVVATAEGPLAAQSTKTVIATCPSGTHLVGGGAQVVPAVQPSVKPIGSYPSDSTGTRAAVTDPDSWVAVGESGGLMNSPPGSPPVMTTALAVCSNDTAMHTVVVRAQNLDHPAGPGNGNSGSDPISTVTATCPTGTTLIGGGALGTGNAPGDDGGNIQQGVHLRGSYPSDGGAVPVGNGAKNPGSWSSIVQSGGQNTPGTDSFAYALCAQAPPAGPPSGGSEGGGGRSEERRVGEEDRP